MQFLSYAAMWSLHGNQCAQRLLSKVCALQQLLLQAEELALNGSWTGELNCFRCSTVLTGHRLSWNLAALQCAPTESVG